MRPTAAAGDGRRRSSAAASLGAATLLEDTLAPGEARDQREEEQHDDEQRERHGGAERPVRGQSRTPRRSPSRHRAVEPADQLRRQVVADGDQERHGEADRAPCLEAARSRGGTCAAPGRAESCEASMSDVGMRSSAAYDGHEHVRDRDVRERQEDREARVEERRDRLVDEADGLQRGVQHAACRRG